MSEYEREDLREHDDATGITLKIIADTDAESPVEEDISSGSVIFAVYHRNRENPSAKQLPTAADAKAFAETNAAPDADWAVFDLFAYEHGNIMFRAGVAGNPFTCAFDSGQAGIIALKRAEFGDDLLMIANGICAAYSSWCNGEVYGYTVTGPGVDDACWGYVGDPTDDGAYTEGKSVFDAAVKEREDAMASEAMEQADLDAAAERAEIARKGRLDELLDAARVFAQPNDTPAAQRLKEALEAYEGAA